MTTTVQVQPCGEVGNAAEGLRVGRRSSKDEDVQRKAQAKIPRAGLGNDANGGGARECDCGTGIRDRRTEAKSEEARQDLVRAGKNRGARKKDRRSGAGQNTMDDPIRSGAGLTEKKIASFTHTKYGKHYPGLVLTRRIDGTKTNGAGPLSC